MRALSNATDVSVARTERRLSSSAGMASQFQAIVTGAVTLIIGVLVFAEIFNSVSIGDAGPGYDNNSGADVLHNASDALGSNTGTAFTLGAVGLLVAAAVVILRMIQGGMGGNGGGM